MGRGTGIDDERLAHKTAVLAQALHRMGDRVSDPLVLLQARVNDENSRVRLEAVRALSFFDNQQALDVAVVPADCLDWAVCGALGTAAVTVKATPTAVITAPVAGSTSATSVSRRPPPRNW